jgi:hypothetical protein
MLIANKSLYNTSIMIMTEYKIDMENLNGGLGQRYELPSLMYDLYINKVLEEWKMIQPKSIQLGIDCWKTTECTISTHEMNMDLHENFQKYNQIN